MNLDLDYVDANFIYVLSDFAVILYYILVVFFHTSTTGCEWDWAELCQPNVDFCSFLKADRHKCMHLADL